jgi:ribosomal-protein-alanine N-acetyltransferase
MTMPIVVPVTSADADVLARIHATSFPSPWKADDFTLFLNQREVAGWATGQDDMPSGFILVRYVADEAEVMTIAVDPAARGNGLGRALLAHAIADLRGRGVRTMFLEVGVRNVPAIALYRMMGFVACGKRKGYYEENAETGGGDAAVMRLDL